MNPNRTYDLEERLLDFAAKIIELCDHPKATFASQHIARQLIRIFVASIRTTKKRL